MSKQLEAWEGEGAAALAPLLPVNFARPGPVQLTGTRSQVEWAERIRRQVNIEFDRVAASFRAVAQKQPAGKRAATEAIIAILEDKRAKVMSRDQAGYFIRDWQEIDDQVRRMIANDPRYAEIKATSRLS
jgi:hypothetical protein